MILKERDYIISPFDIIGFSRYIVLSKNASRPSPPVTLNYKWKIAWCLLRISRLSFYRCVIVSYRRSCLSYLPPPAIHMNIRMANAKPKWRWWCHWSYGRFLTATLGIMCRTITSAWEYYQDGYGAWCRALARLPFVIGDLIYSDDLPPRSNAFRTHRTHNTQSPQLEYAYRRGSSRWYWPPLGAQPLPAKQNDYLYMMSFTKMSNFAVSRRLCYSRQLMILIDREYCRYWCYCRHAIDFMLERARYENAVLWDIRAYLCDTLLRKMPCRFEHERIYRCQRRHHW